MTLFKTWRGWMMAVSAAVGFVGGADVLVRAVQFWRQTPDLYTDPAQLAPSLYGLSWAMLPVVGAVAVFWKRQPLILMAAWALCLGGVFYRLTFVFVPSVRESFDLPLPGSRAVFTALALVALPIAGILLPLPAWLSARRSNP